VVAFCVESGRGFLPSKGFGVQQLGRRTIYHDPGYEVVQQQPGHLLVEINADWWKSYVHSRLQTPAGQPGSLTLFHASPTEHLSFAKHLTAERRVEEFVAGKGLVTRWEAVNRNNHYLDALALACVAGHGIGQLLVSLEAQALQSPAQQALDSSTIGRGSDWLGDTSGWMNRSM
jgi:hypothetical protein